MKTSKQKKKTSLLGKITPKQKKILQISGFTLLMLFFWGAVALTIVSFLVINKKQTTPAKVVVVKDKTKPLFAEIKGLRAALAIALKKSEDIEVRTDLLNSLNVKNTELKDYLDLGIKFVRGQDNYVPDELKTLKEKLSPWKITVDGSFGARSKITLFEYIYGIKFYDESKTFYKTDWGTYKIVSFTKT